MDSIVSMIISLLMAFLQMISSFMGNIAAPDPAPTPDDPDMRWPVDGYSYVSSTFAQNYEGIEIVMSEGETLGTAFYAVKDGTVKVALNDGNDNYGYGNCVLIDHGNGIQTFYTHANKIVVKEKDTVKKGQVIGYIGKTGNASSPNLHFEVWKATKDGGNERVNPLDYVTNPKEKKPDTPTQPDNGSTFDPSKLKGKFTFKVYGWGHGVGMSQDGAIAMAKAGKTYNEIIYTYYPQSGSGNNKEPYIAVDNNTPATVKRNGKDISIVEFLCKTVKQEIGDGAPLEALKAQALVCYTYAKAINSYEKGQAYDDSFKYSGTKVEEAVLAILGMSKATDTPKSRYLVYNGKAAETYYFSNAAGKTASASSVWGGKEIAYLMGGVASPEKVTESTKEYTAKEMYDLISAYAKSAGVKITLSSDPSTWLKVISHDSSMNSSTGYVSKIGIGSNFTMTGNAFRCTLLNYGLKSHCFTVTYTA